MFLNKLKIIENTKKNLSQTSMARDMGPSEIHRPPSWFSGPRTDVPTEPPLIGPDSKDESVIALFNLSFPFSILQFTYKYKSECEENVFLVSNKIC